MAEKACHTCEHDDRDHAICVLCLEHAEDYFYWTPKLSDLLAAKDKIIKALVDALTENTHLLTELLNSDAVIDTKTALSHSCHSHIGKQRTANKAALKLAREAAGE